MTKALEIVDLAGSGQLQLALSKNGDQRAAPAVAFQHPLEASDREQLGWYFQEFLDGAAGPARERAESVEAGLRNLGRLLFELVFQGNDESRSLLAEARAEGLEQYQLSIVSDRPEFLALPWELLNEPEVGYLAPQLSSVVRQRVSGPLPPAPGGLSTEQYNVLLVSPMPSLELGRSQETLAPQTVAALESLKVQVELDYLRPPTFSALSDVLSRRPGHYHLVHFDGLSWDAGAEGLAFEDDGHGPDPVPPARIGELLSAAGVPAALLTSRGITSSNPLDVWSGVASALGEAGVPVVASFPVPIRGSVTGQRLAQRFHESLAEGADVGRCVALARKDLMDNPHRPAAAGKWVFWDWITPTVYQSRSYTPAAIEEEKPDPLVPPVLQPVDDDEPADQLPREGAFGFVGRQGELRQLERLFQQGPAVRLTGATGTGKTEVALGLARWVRKTGSRPGGIFYTTFEVAHPSSLERVVHEIGTAVAGLDFADMSARNQREWVVEYLNDQSCLVILDGAENIAGFPADSPGLLEPEEQAELDAFIRDVTRGDRSWVLLVSRRDREPWRTDDSERALALSGLAGADRLELASAILEQAGVEPNDANFGAEYLELLDLIQGHPLAMQIALPLLKQVPPSSLLGELRKEESENSSSPAGEEGRDWFLTALMERSFGRMSHRSRTHLPFLSLFQRRVMMDILTHMTQERPYRTAMGEELGWGACRTLLRSAQSSGFLEPISPSVYQVHPALPWFLGQKLHRQVPAGGIRQLELEFLRVYADTADYFMESLYENQDTGTTAVLAEEGNLTQALALALEANQWDNAQILVQPLAQVYRMQKRFPELRRLRAQLMEAIGQTAEEAEAKGAIELWMYLLGTDASESLERLELGRAESLNRQLLDHLVEQPEAETDPRAANVYHQFGVIYLHRGRLDEADGWLRRSLAIIEDGEDRAAVADDYYALGQVKQYQRLYTEAKEWYSKALDIYQRDPDEEELVKVYRALGRITQLKFEYQEAESWYNRAREIVEGNRDEETAILIFHELGTVNHAQYIFEEAERWYQQALTLSDRLGNPRQMATELHHLGLMEQTRGLLYDDAEGWYLAALEKYEELGDRRSMGDECRQLGVLFHEQKKYDEAEQWYGQAREIFEELQDVARTSRTYGQLGMVAEQRENLTDALEWVARTYQLAVDHDLPMMIQVKAHLARLRDKYGEENFIEWWRGFTGGDPPTDLDVDASAIL